MESLMSLASFIVLMGILIAVPDTSKKIAATRTQASAAKKMAHAA